MLAVSEQAQQNISVIVLFMDAFDVTAVLESVKRQNLFANQPIVWISGDYWGTARYVTTGEGQLHYTVPELGRSKTRWDQN